MNKISNLTFIYDTAANLCFLQKEKSFRELTIKGPTERNGEITGTWFQVNHLTNHWISFRPDKYRLNAWEAFYKCVQNNQITFYRRLLMVEINTLLVFSFSEQDEWIKENGKWRSKYANK